VIVVELLGGRGREIGEGLVHHSLLNQSTQFSVSISTWSTSRHGPWRRMSSVLTAVKKTTAV
jgi:flagellar biosynthesis/type III secretory pathway ATPase